jgi:hypothetical protein
MIADLKSSFAFVGHVTIDARHARTRVDALVPHLEFRMLRLENRRAGIGMRPILEMLRIVVRKDLFDFQSIRLWVD